MAPLTCEEASRKGGKPDERQLQRVSLVIGLDRETYGRVRTSGIFGAFLNEIGVHAFESDDHQPKRKSSALF